MTVQNVGVNKIFQLFYYDTSIDHKSDSKDI